MEQNKAITFQRLKGLLFPLNRTQRRLVILSALIASDIFTFWLAFWSAYQLRFFLLDYPEFLIDPLYYDRLMLIGLPIWLVLLWVFRLYSPQVLFGGLEEYGRVVNAVSTTCVALIIFDFLTNRAEGFSRGWLILLWLLGCVLLVIFRFLLRQGVYFLRRRGHLLTPAVIVNGDGEGRALCNQLCHSHHSGLRVKGFVDDQLPVGSFIEGDIRVLGTIENLQDLVVSQKIEEVIVATGSLTRSQLLQIYRSVSWKQDTKLRLSSGLFEILSSGLHIKELASVPLIEVNKVRITGLAALLKLLMDFFGSLIIMILFSPLYLIISILIRLDSPGPPFYKHKVLGLNGKPFDAYKFRTMVVSNDELLENNPELREEFKEIFKLKDDPRVTRVGRFLRRHSLDELPQFLNVLLGQMSIVGPRFITPPEIEKFGKWDMNLLTVKPGITGLWQVSGRSDVSYEERVRMDMYYITNWSIWLDIYLLLRTIPSMISGRGAY